MKKFLYIIILAMMVFITQVVFSQESAEVTETRQRLASAKTELDDFEGVMLTDEQIMVWAQSKTDDAEAAQLLYELHKQYRDATISLLRERVDKLTITLEYLLFITATPEIIQITDDFVTFKIYNITYAVDYKVHHNMFSAGIVASIYPGSSAFSMGPYFSVDILNTVRLWTGVLLYAPEGDSIQFGLNFGLGVTF